MSDTLGSLIDKQSILMIRRACASDEGTKKIIDNMIGKGKDHINQFYYEVVSGLITEKDMIVQPKLKSYAHQNNTVVTQTKIGEAINTLIDANITLWGIEDDRRDTSKTESERLVLADSVSTWNKKRNDAMGQIDELLWQQMLAKAPSVPPVVSRGDAFIETVQDP